MVLTKKLDSLEEFRQQKEQLMNKFEKLETDSKQKMEDYEKRLYDLEKSHIREQDRLKVGTNLSFGKRRIQADEKEKHF